MTPHFDRKTPYPYISKMSDSQQLRILQALAGLMKPIARFLLRSGISYKDFSEVAKKAFVDNATDFYGVRGRPTNVSRVALLTGLTRKEVRQLKTISGSESSSLPGRRSLPAEVLHRWHTADGYFDNSRGLPVDLPFTGEKPSFDTLVRECMRDIPPGAVRAELKRLGVITETENGLLRAVKREVVPLEADQRLVEGLETGLNPLARTIVFNSDPSNAGVARFQRIVSVPFVKNASMPEIETELGRRLVAFTEELDDYLVRFETDEGQDDCANGVGVGIYYFREEE